MSVLHESAAEAAGTAVGAPREVHPGQPTRRITVIRPTRGWASLRLRELWQYRDLLVMLALRDIKLRYRQTALGAFWVVFQPLVTAGVFSLIFGVIAGIDTGDTPFFVFAFASMLAWNVFATTLTRASTSLVGSTHLVSKVYFPRMILPLTAVPSALLDFGVGLAVLVVLMALGGVVPHIGLLLLPLFLLLLLLLAMGLGLLAAALAVSYRDIQYVVPVLVQVLMLVGAVQFPASAVLAKIPAAFHPLFYANPLVGLMEGFRWALLAQGTLRWDLTLWAAVCAVVLFAVGMTTFRNMERSFADVI